MPILSPAEELKLFVECASATVVSKSFCRGPSGLSRLVTLEMIKRLDLSSPAPKIIVVAGTKGKGSVCSLTSQILVQRGMRVGLFTSPHVQNVSERIQINGKTLSSLAERFVEFRTRHDHAFFQGTLHKPNSPHPTWSECLVDWAKRDTMVPPTEAYRKSVADAAAFLSNDTRSSSQPTAAPMRSDSFFRFLFLFACDVFSRENVDAAILEIGIGGRHDCVNVFDSLTATAITALGYDHCDLLGHTLESIAGEKVEIVRSGVPCVVMPQVDHPELNTILQEWIANKTALQILKPLSGPGDDAFAQAYGKHMKSNLQIARALVAQCLPNSSITANAMSLHPPLGRSHVLTTRPVWGLTSTQEQQLPKTLTSSPRKVTYVVDGAHTAESIAAFGAWFSEVTLRGNPSRLPSCVVVFYTSRNPIQLLRPLVRSLSLNAAHSTAAQSCLIRAILFVHHRSKGPANLTPEESTVVDNMLNAFQSLKDELGLAVTCQSVRDKSIQSARQLSEELSKLVKNQEQTTPCDEVDAVLVTGSFYLVGSVLNLI